MDTQHQQNEKEFSLHFDGDNSYPDCKCCGKCCERVSILCVSTEEIKTIRAYMAKHNIVPTDYSKQHCCFMRKDRRCDIWEVRPQTCRLYNCHIPRKDILRLNPDIVVDDSKPLIDMHDAFLKGDTSDPRYRDGFMQQSPLDDLDISIGKTTYCK